jgi:cathepsin B
MKVLTILALFCISLVAADHHNRITRERLNELRTVAKFQVADYDEHIFKDMTSDEIKSKLGLHMMPKRSLKPVFYGNVREDFPESFDGRTQWPDCIHPIRDQGNCGSCWAFAASEVLSDRICIATSGKTNVVLSPQDFVSCDSQNHGCEGGFIDKSWDYLVQTGIVSDECLPYSSGKGESGTCPFNGGKNQCKGGEFKKYHAKSHGQVVSIEAAKETLMKHGPIEAGFMVFDDFISYKGGVYHRTSEQPLGGHGVKVVGWGKEGDEEYWIVANSWGAKWGEKGFFRIAFGECWIEDGFWTGEAAEVKAESISYLQ